MTKFSPLEAHFAAQRALEHLHLFNCWPDKSSLHHITLSCYSVGWVLIICSYLYSTVDGYLTYFMEL